MESVRLRSGALDYDTNAVSDETAVDCSKVADGEIVNRTQQHFAEECDINTIVKRFGLTGEMPENIRPPVYGDFTGVMDYQTALNAVIDAQNAFMEMPAAVRERFANDPQRLVEFLSKVENREEAVKLGLVNKANAIELAAGAAAAPAAAAAPGAAAPAAAPLGAPSRPSV